MDVQRQRVLVTGGAGRLGGPVLWLTRRFIGPVFGKLVVRLLASRYGVP